MKDKKLPTVIFSIKSIVRDTVPEIEGRVRGQLYRLVYKLEKSESNKQELLLKLWSIQKDYCLIS